MELLGRMTEAGRAQYPTKEFEIMPEILEALKQEDPFGKISIHSRNCIEGCALIRFR